MSTSLNKNSVIIIPARMAATRLPGKPLIDICGISMIERVLKQAIIADIAQVFVATPDKEIYDVVTRSGYNSIMTTGDHQSGTDRIYEALCKLDNNIKYVINLQGDLPLIDPESIKLLHNSLINSNSEIATLGAYITDNNIVNDHNIVKIAISEDNRAIYFSRNPIPYSADKYIYHIGIYGYRRDILTRFIDLKPSRLEKIEKLEQLRAIENNINIDVTMIDSIPYSVDNIDDLNKVKSILS